MREVEPERRRAPVPRAATRSSGSPSSAAASSATTARPQDIEWAIDRRLDELFLLQARPETVWSAEAEAVAGRGEPARGDRRDVHRRPGEAAR